MAAELSHHSSSAKSNFVFDTNEIGAVVNKSRDKCRYCRKKITTMFFVNPQKLRSTPTKIYKAYEFGYLFLRKISETKKEVFEN